MDASATARLVTNADDVLADPSSVARSDRLTDDASDVVLFDTRDRQINPLRTTMTVAEALEDSLGPRR